MTPATRVPRPASLVIIALYATLAFLVFPVYPHFPSPNELTRWALVASVVEYGTIEVSRVAPILGPQFEDLAVVDGHEYSNKAPGLALLAAPGYLLVRPFIGPPSPDNLRPALTAMRWFGATIPLLLLALVMARIAEEHRGNGELATVVLLFATPLFAYGLLLFSHVVTGAALFGAWWLLFVRGRGAILAGALIGLAVASEYPMVVPAAVLVVAAWRQLPRLIIGGGPFAILLAVYQKLAFGSVFGAPYTYEKFPQYRELAHTGLFGIHPPNLEIFLRTLFDPARGLLLFSPVLILCLFGRPKLPRAALATLILVPIAILAIYSGYPNWYGGWNIGPRYVLSALPFLVFPIAFLEERWFVSLLIGMSAATVVPLTLTFPFPDRGIAFPWATLAWPLLRNGLVAPNLLHLLWRPLAIVVPFAIVTAALRRRVAGALVTIAISAIVMHPTMTDRLRVAYIEEVFFERRDAMAKAVPNVPPAAAARARRDLTLPPSTWPF